MLALLIGLKGVGAVVGLVIAAGVAAYAFRGKEQKLVDAAGSAVKVDVSSAASTVAKKV